MNDFQEPDSVNEAEDRLLALLSGIRVIELQLANRNRQSQGKRLSREEYNEWRSRTVSALKHKQNEVAQLKLWLKRQVVPVASENAPADLRQKLLELRRDIDRILDTLGDRTA